MNPESTLAPFQALNTVVPAFARQLQSKLRGRVPIYSGDGRASVRAHTSKREGITDRIALRFHRYLVFREKGAGRGMGGAKGSKWLSPKGKTMTTKASSLGKMNTGARKALPWFNPTIRQEHPRLAQIVADTVAGSSISSLKYWLLKGDKAQ